MNVEPDPDAVAGTEDDVDPGAGTSAEAQRILRSAVEQAAVLQVEASAAIEAQSLRRVISGEHEIAERLAQADREAAERVRAAVATAAELMLNVRTEAERIAKEITDTARANADVMAEHRLAEADRIASELLLSTERLARDILEEARSEAAVLSPPPPTGPPAAEGGRPSTSDPRPDEAPGSGEVPPPDDRGRSGRPRRRAHLLGKTTRVVLLVVVGVVGSDLVRSCVAEPYTVASTSMEPELKDGNRLVVDKVAYRLGDIGRGDVVVFDPSDVSEASSELGGTLVKRVIGLPGETVEGVDGRVLIDGVVLDEPWHTTANTPEFGPVLLPEGSLFLLGDNRVISIDSRTFGPVPTDAVIGRVDAVIWPPGDAGPL